MGQISFYILEIFHGLAVRILYAWLRDLYALKLVCLV